MYPRLLTLGNFTLHTYGLLVAAGFLAGIYMAQRFARKFGLNPEQIFNLAIYLALAAMIGSKLFLVLQDWRFYLHHPGQLFSLSLLESAGIFYGGVVGALLVMILYVRHFKMNWLAVGDAIVPGVAIGHAIGRLGCFSAGCCWGRPVHPIHLPWLGTITPPGLTFTSAYAHATVSVPLNIPLYPTQLIESACELIIFLLLWQLARRRAFVGQLTAVYLIAYGLVRFFVDFLRRISPHALLFGGWMSAGQLTSLFAIALGITILALKSRRPALAVRAATQA